MRSARERLMLYNGQIINFVRQFEFIVEKKNEEINLEILRIFITKKKT